MLADYFSSPAAFALMASVLLLLLALGMRVPFVLMVVSLGGFYLFLPARQLEAIGSIMWDSVDKSLLSAVPLFVLMGELFSRSSLSSRTYLALAPLVARIPGGLWHSNIAACTVFSAASGSSVGTAAAMGSIAIPRLNERGYPRRLSYGTIAAGGTLGILIPPSLGMIIYGSLTGVSIKDLFIAGLVPGLVLAGLFGLYVVVWSLRHRDAVPRSEKVGLFRSFRAIGAVAPLLALIVLVLGSLYLGFATPTESAAVGATGVLLLSLLYGPRDRKVLTDAATRTVGVSVMILLILIGASLLTYVVGYLRVPGMLAEGLTGIGLPPYVVLIGIALLFLVLGMFLDPISVLSLTMPVVFPAAEALGYDPVWFGVFVVVNVELGLITPPVGLNLFIIKGIDPTASWGDIVLGTLPFVGVMSLFLVLLVVWPDMALWLVPT